MVSVGVSALFRTARPERSIRGSQFVEFFGLLGGGQKDAGLDGLGRPPAQLAILPGLTHYNIGSALWLAPAVIPFLDAPMPEASREPGPPS
jgi:hypothetical protein